MKKQSINLCLLAALLCGLSLTVTSCKDDDDDNGSNGDESEIVVAPTETEEAKAALNWLANMTNVEEFTDDWASKTYEPTIGVESKNDANTRVVVVANIDYARMNFSSISGIDPDKLSSVQSQTIDGVGTVTWTPSAADANNLATVDVNTKLIPHLSKIVYCTMEQAGDNGSTFDGTAYFRFGDVIEDSEGYYWVCVKPAFGTGSAPQQQGYWINILNRDKENGKSSNGVVPDIPKGNICSDYDGKYNGNTILLPTKLKSTKEMTHNLANLVWALLNPGSYEATVGYDGIGLGGYDYKYNGKKFCQRVADQWTQKGIWQKLFNRTYEQMKQMKKLNFYYEGYHFTPKIHLGSSNLGCATVMGTKKYEPNYVTTYNQDSEKNLEMKEKGAGFDMRRYCSDPDQNADCASSSKAGYAPAQQFTSTTGYWIVRQKTSSDLAGSFLHPSVYINLKNTAEIYRYNAAYGVVVGKDTPVETEDDLAATSFQNRAYYTVGDIVKDKKARTWICVQPSAYGNDQLFKQQPYSYFISFDEDAVTKQFTLDNIPDSKELAAQILFDLELLYQNYFAYGKSKESDIHKRIKNMSDNMDVEITELLAKRDTLHKFSFRTGGESVLISFGSALYRNGDNQICVLRLVSDYTKESNGDTGGRDMTYYFYANYTNSNTVMKLDDLGNADIIKANNKDQWVSLPWVDFATRNKITDNTGPRTQTENVSDLQRFVYTKGRSAQDGTVPANMYREPIIAFAVERVRDDGRKVSQFDDKLEFREFKMMRDEYKVDEEDIYINSAKDSYSKYCSRSIFLENKNWQFGMANSIPE